jgi:hypothetical protein
MTREPGRVARELRELEHDPSDWIEGPCEPRRLSIHEPWHRLDRGVLLVLVLLALVGAVAFVRWVWNWLQ